jgi:CRP-like cAMP-binding protein
MNDQEIFDIVNAKSGFAGNLSLATVQKMHERGQIRRFAPGEFITRKSQNEPRFCITLSGHVRLTAFTQDGREMLTHIVRPGDCWGVHPCLGQFQETNDTVAEVPCEVLMIKPDAVDALMWSRHDFQRAMVAVLCKRLNLAVSIAEQLGSWTARERVAWRLLLLSNGLHGRDADQFISEISVSQETLASMVHLSRQRTNVILKTFEKEGLIDQKYGRIKILSLDDLRRQTDRIS